MDKETIIVLVCDHNKNTGEGILSNSLIDIMHTKDLRILIYKDILINTLERIKFLRDRILPFYLIFISFILKIKDKKVIYLNYCPIWNPFIFIAARFGVLLGPITGSCGIYPYKKSLNSFFRYTIYLVLIFFSKIFINKDLKLWAGTPSVKKVLEKTKAKLIYGIPTLINIDFEKEDYSDDIKPTKIFSYSSNHILKNHELLIDLIKKTLPLGNQFFLVSKDNLKLSGLKNIKFLNKINFDKTLKSSTHYLSLSFEDGGIAFYQSIAYGVEVIFPYESPKNKFFRSSVKFNIRNTKSAAEQIKLIDKYKIRKSENINFNFSYLVKEFQLTKQSIETWISWM